MLSGRSCHWWLYVVGSLTITCNGPAIKFSRCYLAKRRPRSFIFSHEEVPVQDRYGAVFAVRVQINGFSRVSRYKLTKYLVLSHVAETSKRALEQCRVTNLLWNQNWVRVHKFYWEQLRVSRFILLYLSIKRVGAVCKNCDEPINFIDRVSCRTLFINLTLINYLRL